MKKDALFNEMLKKLEPYFDYVILFLAVVTLSGALLQSQRPGLSVIGLYDLVSGLGFLFIYLFRSKLVLHIKLMTSYLLLLGFSIVSLYISGFMGNGLLNMALLIVVSMAFFSRAAAIILSTATVGILSLLSLFALAGKIDLTRYSVERLHSPVDWVYQSIMLLVFAMVCYFSVYSIKRMLVDSIVKQEEANNSLKAFAFTDRLTGLPNQVALFNRFSSIQPENIESIKMVAIVDITDFKSLNANYGFSLADEYLKALGKEGFEYINLNANQGSVYKIGDTEFALVVDTWTRTELEQFLSTVASKIRLNHQALSTLPQQHYIAGYTFWNPIEHDFERAFNQCTITIEYAKSNRITGVLPFDQQIYKRFEEKSKILSEIETALNNDEFYVVFQGKWSAKASKFIGYEALTRWVNSQNQMIPPDVFIPLINQSTHLNQFNRYITEKALREFARLSTRNDEIDPAYPIKVSLNISPLFFLSNDFSTFIIDAVNNAGLLMKQVVLEITEDVFIGDYREINMRIDELTRNGFHISLDDFGSGYSSLSHINALTIHELKVDKSIIQGVLDNPKSLILVETIANMGEKMGCTLVAEGVETEEQFQRINHLGFDIVQGYYFSKPIRVDEILKQYDTK